MLAGKSGYDVVVPTAYFLQRQITANIFQKLDKSKLPNLVNAWPEVTKRLATYDPGNLYAANYMWGTTGIGYNVKAVQKILGADARIDSWDIVFKPENLAKFRDCGIHMLDSADDILPAALNYLGLDPNSTRQADLEKAADIVIPDRAADRLEARLRHAGRRGRRGKRSGSVLAADLPLQPHRTARDFSALRLRQPGPADRTAGRGPAFRRVRSVPMRCRRGEISRHHTSALLNPRGRLPRTINVARRQRVA